MALFLLDIRLPDIINNVLESISGASLPVTMFVIGAQIGSIDFKALGCKWRVFVVTAAKLLVVPVLMYFISVKIIKCDTLAIYGTYCIVCHAYRCAAAIFAQEYGADSQFAAEAVFLTDIFCLITLPVTVVML